MSQLVPADNLVFPQTWDSCTG